MLHTLRGHNSIPGMYPPPEDDGFALELKGAYLTDKGLEEIGTLKELRWLDLGGTMVTNAGLKKLVGLKQLRVLNLSATKITDDGLKELPAFENLRWLDLSHSQVSPKGLKELFKLKNLRELHLRRWPPDIPPLLELKKSLPNCTIVTSENIGNG